MLTHASKSIFNLMDCFLSLDYMVQKTLSVLRNLTRVVELGRIYKLRTNQVSLLYIGCIDITENKRKFENLSIISTNKNLLLIYN